MYKKILLCFITTTFLNASENVIKKESFTKESKQTNRSELLTPTDKNASGCEETDDRAKFLSKDENLFSDVVIQPCEK